MPTNEERREAVKRLREDARLGALPFIDFLGAVAYDVAVERDERGVLNRLADLIDPICEVHRDTVFRPAVLYPDRELDDVGREETVFRCGKCCEIVSYDEDYNPETDSPAYCETCGSRIIGIGEPWDE